MLIPALLLFSIALMVVAVWLRLRSIAANKELEAMKKKTGDLVLQQKDFVERIQQMQNEKQQLLGIVSHDLKGPLNRIFALIQLLGFSSENLRQEQKEYLDKIHIMVADGLGMIRNLTDSQKLETDAITLHEDAFNLSQVINTSVRNNKAVAEKKKQQLLLTQPSSLMVFADKYIITRILDNLLSNAIKFTNEGKQIFIEAREDGSRIKIAVRDEGPGISEEDQRNLFKQFMVLSSRPTGGETTSGIGLFVAKALAAKGKMELSCASILGEGTTFTVSINKERS
jgi:signal transduction histidine kinase